jgi:hypothetical protein
MGTVNLESTGDHRGIRARRWKKVASLQAKEHAKELFTNYVDKTR